MGIHRRLGGFSHTVAMKIVLAAAATVFLYLSGVLPFALSLCLAVGVHEMGHISAAMLLGADIMSFKGTFLGLRICYSSISLGTAGECIVNLSGSLFGLLSAAAVSITPLIRYDFFISFAALSVTLALVNLLPVRGLDGGSTVMCILDRFMLPDRSEKIMNIISTASAIAFWVVSIRIQLRSGVNLSVLALSVYFLAVTLRKA